VEAEQGSQTHGKARPVAGRGSTGTDCVHQVHSRDSGKDRTRQLNPLVRQVDI